MTKPSNYESVAGLSVHPALRAFVEQEVLPAARVDVTAFWPGLAAIIADLTPRHQELLAIRDDLQGKIDAYHRSRKGQPHDTADYEQFLRDIGYLVPAPAADAYAVATKNADTEIGTVAGPHLVVPLSNAHSALDAVNARWGSLYDALRETGEIAKYGGTRDGDESNRLHKGRMIARVRAFLDQAFPLATGSHADAASYAIERGKLEVALADGSKTGLKSAVQLAGFTGPRHGPTSVLLVNNGLHIELVIDRKHPVGEMDAAGIADVVIEAAISVIMDLEDTVAAVDVGDKIAAYRNWLQLMDGSLGNEFTEAGETVTHRLAGDRIFTAAGGGLLSLRGRSIMLLRHVGHRVLTDAILDEAGNPVPEAIIDAAVTIASSAQDIRGEGAIGNSRTGSVYIVKPKMHGPEEVGLADLLFKRIEELLGLPKYTIKIGVMDEERRTSVNLAACLSRVRDRTVFIGTDVLDRAGDEIHTSMEAAPVARRSEMENAPWRQAYETNNIGVGIARNLPGRAQIGQGTWSAPDQMTDLIENHITHPLAGAGTSRVPTPAAAALHAMHYHLVDVASVQDRLRSKEQVCLADLLSIPLATRAYSEAEITAELESNLSELLALVVRWVDQGIGLLIAPSSGKVGLTQDRATIRVASLHVANWLHHGLVSEDRVRQTMRRMAALVDQQNIETEGYRPLLPGCDGPAFRAAEELVFTCRGQPNGYTETILFNYRREAKSLMA